MEQVFLTILNMSITASWLVLVVIFLRIVLRKVPKSFAVVMWALVGIRLICPFSVESEWSLMPRFEKISENMLDSEHSLDENGIPSAPEDTYFTDTQMGNISNEGKHPEQVPSQNQGESSNTHIQAGVNAGQGNRLEDTSFLEKFVGIAPRIWFAGMLVMLAYSMITYFRLHRKVSISLCMKENIYLCDEIDTPFIFGIIKPRIYIPSGMETEQIQYVVEHERAHWQRKDHWWKPLGFTLLAVHWFNPVMWLAYILLCRDIELACDEKVIKNMSNLDKKGYSETLLACSVPRRMILACPLAFGEVGVKERVKFMRQYKKPAFWIIVVSVVVCIVLAVGCLTNPKEETNENENWWKPTLSVNEYAKVWKEGSYPSLIMYNNTLYAASKMPEKEIVHERKGIVKSSVDQGIPMQNFQSNDVDLVGCTIHAWSGDYIYVLRGDEYFAYKDVTADDDLFNDVNAADGSREDANKTKAFVQNKYLLALADTEHNYLQYYGGSEVGEANTRIVYLTEINDEIVVFYNEIIRTTYEIVYKECEISMQERNTTYEYITTFLKDYVPTKDTELNDLVESITSGSCGHGNEGISISIIGCTKEKIELFREKICNYEHLEFPNSDPWEEKVIITGKTPYWGITLSVKNVTSTGATLVCEQFGGMAEGTLRTGNYFVVHKYTEKGWVEAGDTRNVVWDSMGIVIPRTDRCEWTINWKNIYGKLPEGRYRIGKEFSDNYDDVMFYAEFTIEESDAEKIVSTPEPTIVQKPVRSEEKEIVFANTPWVYTTISSQLVSYYHNVFESIYEPQNSDTLYAFCLKFENFLGEDYPIQKGYETDEEWVVKERDFWTKEILQIVEETGLILLSDYPYCHYNQESLNRQNLRIGLCAVAGTLDQMKELFDRTSSFDGLCLHVLSAPRPDLLQKMKEAGWTGPSSALSWFEMNEEKIRPFIGNEKQVTQVLEVKTETK